MKTRYITNFVTKKVDQKLSSEKHEQIVQCIMKCLNISKKEFKCDVKLNELQYSTQMSTKTYGKAGYSLTEGWFVRLSLYKMEKNFDFMLKEIIPHEVAHVVSMWLKDRQMAYGDDGHGEGWKHVAKMLGCTPSAVVPEYEEEPSREMALYQYKTLSGTVVEVNQEQHHCLQQELRVLRTKEGERIVASGFVERSGQSLNVIKDKELIRNKSKTKKKLSV
jgi:predicted SprT family Zn-dependent metalloprotease